MLQPAHPPPASHPAAPHGAEKELAQHRTALAAVTAERDSLREDLAAVKEAKRRADQGFKSQLDRANALDKELAFYQVGLGWGGWVLGQDVGHVSSTANYHCVWPGQPALPLGEHCRSAWATFCPPCLLCH